MDRKQPGSPDGDQAEKGRSIVNPENRIQGNLPHLDLPAGLYDPAAAEIKNLDGGPSRGPDTPVSVHLWPKGRNEMALCGRLRRR